MAYIKDFDQKGLHSARLALSLATTQEGFRFLESDTGKSYRWDGSAWDLLSDNSISVTGLLELKGSTDCSSNPNYPNALVGDAYYVTVAGKIGGASGKSVDIGDLYVAKADNAGGTEASVGTSWFVLEHNLVGALLASNNLSDLASVITARANLGLEAAKVDVSSNSTTNIGAATSMLVRITGTTTITAFDTVADGVWRHGYFSGALTLTHNGTSLILPGGANITTAAGDSFVALSLGSGNWKILAYQKADGTAIVGGGGGGTGTSNLHSIDDPTDAYWAGGDLGFDLEFDANTSSLPSGVGWVNQDSSTYTERGGAGTIARASQAGDHNYLLTRSLSGAPSTWLMTGKFTAVAGAGNYLDAGLVIRESGSGHFMNLILRNFATAVIFKWDSPTAFNNVITTFSVPTIQTFYFRIRKNSVSSFDFEISYDGLSWRTVQAAYNVGAYITPDEYGFEMLNGSGEAGGVSCHWIRLR